MARRFGPLLLSDRRERERLDLERAARARHEPPARVGLRLVRRVGDHDINGRVVEMREPGDALAFSKVPIRSGVRNR